MASSDRCDSLKKLCVCGGRLNLGRALCGPLSVQKPLAASVLQHGTAATAQWRSDYATPGVKKVKVSLVNRANGHVTVLGAGQPTTGMINFNVPNTPTNDAIIRIESEQKSMFVAESGRFQII